MVRPILIIVSLILGGNLAFSQQQLKGNVLDGITLEPIPNATIRIENTILNTKSNPQGEFSLTMDLADGEYLVRVEKSGYLMKRFPIQLQSGSLLELTDLTLEVDATTISQEFIISLTDDELAQENEFVGNNAGLLQATKDVFLKAVAYDFSAVFFNPRGLDQSSSKLLINGVEMNKLYNGRPLWANWGGLNDVQRNQEFYIGSTPNPYGFGDLGGTNNINMRASKYRSGGRISAAASNRTYQGRIMASYNSGMLKNDWAFSISASSRFGEQGYVAGTPYQSISFFAAVEKKINNNHSINILGIYSENTRGKSAPLTEEVFKLKGPTYNPYWGYLNGDKKNSRIRNIEEPFIILSHYWNPISKWAINTNISYQFGQISNTRIDNGGTWLVDFNDQTAYFGGGRNPDPVYYQRLPSYFLRNGGENPTSYAYELAYLAEQDLLNNGQLNWNRLFNTNRLMSDDGKNATYLIQEDRTDDDLLSANSIISYQLNEVAKINGGIFFKHLKSHNYALVNDMLGGNQFLDIDFFADETGIENTSIETLAQSDLRNSNRLVRENDIYKYNYNLYATSLKSFIQYSVFKNNLDWYFGIQFGATNFQREGLFENGHYPGNDSYGKRPKLNFYNFGIKAGGTYRLSGKQIFEIHTFFSTQPPTLSRAFINPRQNNNSVKNLSDEFIGSVVGNYIFRSERLISRVSAYYSKTHNSTDLSFYYTEDLAGLGYNTGDANVQEVVSGIDTRRFGLEFGGSYELTTSLKIKAAASHGSFTYNNNPNIYLNSVKFSGDLVFGKGKTNIKNLHVASGPETAIQIGLEYNDPAFWWLGTTVNYFANQYIDISYLSRSENFSSDYDAQPILNYDPVIAKKVLTQERFDDFILCNIVGGKSWRLGDYYLGFFGVVSNVFNSAYKTGGYEQSRIAKYNGLLAEQTANGGRVFGPKYFYGYGTTYYISLNLRF